MSSVARVLHVEISEGVGGIETFLLNVYRNIDRSKVQFDFISSKEKVAIEKQIIQLGGRIYRIKYGNGFNYYNKLFQLISTNGYTVVHIHKNSAANIIPFLACKRAGVKTVIAHSHNTNPSKGKITRILHYINRPILNVLCHERIACSDLAAVWMFGKSVVDKNEVIYIRNGIEIERFIYNAEVRRSVREKLGLHDDTFVIGNVGRMTRQKNQIFLVDILFEVKREYENAKLLICGDGDLRDEILKRAKALKVEDDLILPGQCKNIHEMLQAMDVYVMPSLYEGLTVAAVEAQCAGLPTIISDMMSGETMLVEQCSSLSLKASAKQWAEKVLEYKSIERKNTGTEIRITGYDIKKTAVYLQKFYMNKIHLRAKGTVL